MLVSIACLTMVVRLAQCAEQHWRAVNGSKLLADVIRGVQFVDGKKEEEAIERPIRTAATQARHHNGEAEKQGLK